MSNGFLIGLRLQPDLLSALDAYCQAQDDQPSRPEAIRRLLSTGLERELHPRAPSNSSEEGKATSSR